MQLITTKGEVVIESVWDQVKDSRVDSNNKLDTKHRLAQSKIVWRDQLHVKKVLNFFYLKQNSSSPFEMPHGYTFRTFSD